MKQIKIFDTDRYGIEETINKELSDIEIKFNTKLVEIRTTSERVYIIYEVE